MMFSSTKPEFRVASHAAVHRVIRYPKRWRGTQFFDRFPRHVGRQRFPMFASTSHRIGQRTLEIIHFLISFFIVDSTIHFGFTYNVIYAIGVRVVIANLLDQCQSRRDQFFSQSFFLELKSSAQIS